MMFSSWWRTLVMKRMTRAARARTQLRTETLEPRDTPAGVFASAVAPGNAPEVAVFDAVTKQQKFTINAVGDSFTGGVNVAVGDVNGDGTADIITGAKAGGGAAVSVFSGVDGTLLKTFTVGDDASRAGVSVAAADFDGDGRVEIVAGGVLNGQPIVQVLRFSDGTALQTFTPFAGAHGVSVAAGDFNGDGTPDVVVGAGVNGSPSVVVFNGKDGSTLLSQEVFEDAFRGGVTVSAADLNGDGNADVIVCAQTTGGPRVTVLAGPTGAVIQNFFADSETLRDGVEAVAFDADANGRLDLVTHTSTGLKAFDGLNLATLPAPTTPGLPVAAVYDTIAPTATVSTTATNPTTTSPIPFRIVFSESVNGFSAAGVAATNGTVSNFVAVDAKTYTLNVTPTAAGAVTLTVNAGAAFDAAGNGNATASGSATFSTGAPTVTIQSQVTKNTTPTITGHVDDPAATVVVGVNGQSINATVDSNGNYSATVPTALTPGIYTVTAAATNAKGQTGNATQTNGLVIDTTAPTPTVSSTAPEPTKTSPIPFTVTFDKDVTGFTSDEVKVINGSVGKFTPVDKKTYTFNVTAGGPGAVIVSVPAGVATDTAGNTNVASAPLTRTLDTVAPTITANPLTTSDNTPTLTGTVSDSTATVSVTVAGTTLAATVANNTWSVTIPSPLTDGPYTIDATATDPAGNTNTVTLALGLVIDTKAPTVTLSTTSPSPTNASMFSITIQFSDVVDGFDASDLSVSNGQASNLQSQDNRTFTADITPKDDGPVMVTVPANVAQSHDVQIGNTAAASPITIISDRTPPTPTITSGEPSVTAASTIHIMVDFGETVTGFSLSGVMVNNSSPPKNFAGSGAVYTFDVTPVTDGTVTVTVNAAAAQDTAGNASLQRTFTITFDQTPPSGMIDTTSTGPITGTASDATAGVQMVQVMISQTVGGTTTFWNGTAFSSPTAVPLTATTSDGFAHWMYGFTGPAGTYQVTIRVTDNAGNVGGNFGGTPVDVTVGP
jgi:hypothetical protein